MLLVFPEQSETVSYPRLGENFEAKGIWIFPDMEKSFGSVKLSTGQIIIDPSYYFITSGEAVRKTEVLISDIEESFGHHEDEFIVEQLQDMLVDVRAFYQLLLDTRGSSLYLEVTKCEDGTYNGNICARKDPKPRKNVV